MAPTHVTKRQAATPRAAANKKAAARPGTADVKDETATAAEAEQPTLDAAAEAEQAAAEAPAEAPVEQDAPETVTVQPSPSLDVQTPAQDEQEAPAAGRASLLQALATGEKPEAATEAPAPAPTVQPTGRREKWTEDEDAVQVIVTADLFKATVDGQPRFGYRGSIITLPAAVAERGMRFNALTLVEGV